MKKAFLGLFVLLLLIAAGCKASLEEAEQNYCLALGELGQALAGAENLHANSTVDEAEQVQKNLEDALKDVQDAAAELQEVKLDTAQSAFDGLKGAIADIPGDSTLEEARGMVVDSAEQFRETIDDLYGVTCD
jgi:phage-related minor tail protein